MMNDKITASHLARQAVIYVRQSTLEQVNTNLESQRRQYALRDRAFELGWQPSNVVVIDDDLGVSGSGVARSGFDRLVSDCRSPRAIGHSIATTIRPPVGP